MPPSNPSRLPSKKRRASSASVSNEESKETPNKEAPSTRKEHDETEATNTPQKTDHSKNNPKISPRRLPSKKRKSSRDSTQASVDEESRKHTETQKEQEHTVHEATNEHQKDTQDLRKRPPKELLKHPPPAAAAAAAPPTASQAAPTDQSPERKTRLDDSADGSASAGLRKYSSDGLLSTSSSPGRVRLRAGSQTSLELRLRAGSMERPRSGSMASLDDAWKRKTSHDSSTIDILGTASRKESNDTTHSFKLDVLMDLPPPEPININPRIGEATGTRPRSSSTASLVSTGGAALAHLDALGDDAKPPPAAKMDTTDDHSSAAETFASSGHRVLMEAIKLSTGGEGENASKGSGSQEHGLPTRTRLESWGGGSGRERLGSLGSVLEASAFHTRGRDRLESWGGMSDISINFNASAGGSSGDRAMSSAAAAAMAAAAVAEQFHLAGAGEDLAGLGLFDEQGRPRTASIPSRISVGRDRFNSIASFSDNSFLPDGAEVTIDLNAIVSAAMAHVGDLAELAGVVETVAGVGAHGDARERSGSEGSSVASPMIGALLEGAGKRERRQRPRSSSTSSKMSGVDYEALAQAVDAAHAVTGNIDLEKFDDGSSTEDRSRKDKGSRLWRRQLPLKRDRTTSETSDEALASANSVSETEMNRIRKRARAAASTSLQSEDVTSSRKKKSVPIKKRVRRQNSSPPESERQLSSSSVGTPRASNRAVASMDEFPDAPLSSDRTSSKGQASQKWDSMYDALLVYVEDRRQEETTGLSDDEKKEWAWDGNVPTTYKAPDGKALGRWVNNQRSAKSKGTLKPDREKRLDQAGLKWSVLASNSWNETLEELRNYIEEQTADGKEWDGNVPTHYQIKAKPNGKFAGEDKNLGRWVNRQRSLYQAGKLRKDRQIALEELGLKWSMLSSTSWEAMYETLRAYVAERKAREGTWDGNVPANYRTTDNPPRALGRWINRQRSAFTKGKLKSEYVDKLNSIGLKWSVHEKNGYGARAAQSKTSTTSERSVGATEDSTSDSNDILRERSPDKLVRV